MALHFLLLLMKSVVDSQVPRLDLLRKAIEEVNGAFHSVGIIIREEAAIFNAELIGQEYKATDLEKYRDLQDRGMELLTNAEGHLLAIGQVGIANELRPLNNWIADQLDTFENLPSSDAIEKNRVRIYSELLQKRKQILSLMEVQLREEAHLGRALERYF